MPQLVKATPPANATSQPKTGKIEGVRKQEDASPIAAEPYAVVATLFVSALLISNIAATKLIQFDFQSYKLIFDGGAVLFPLTYILGDVLAEVYGFRRARSVILLGFVISGLTAGVFLLIQVAPPATEYAHQEAYEAVLGFVPRIVVASLIAYLIGELLNAYILVAIKRRFGQKRLWVRLIGSSLVGEAADTLVFCTIAFYGVLTGGHFWNYVLLGYTYKIAVEVALLPASYAGIRLVRRLEPRKDPST